MLFVRTVWLQSPVKEGHDSESGRSATGYISISFSFTEHIAYSETQTATQLFGPFDQVTTELEFRYVLN
jgi:hypothetical protein